MTATATPETLSDDVRESRKLPSLSTALPLAAVLVVSLGFNLWGLSRNGYDSYYAASVYSATHSWKAFFFGSLDTHSFITVDKPPLAFWAQALLARTFGFGTWALLLPEALAGVATVAVLYRTVQLVFGRAAGLIAALAMALTPVSVAVARSNHPDMVLTLLITVAAWGTVSAARSGRTWPLVGAGAALGLAFMAKMWAGLIPAPALALVYLAVAPVTVRRRLAQLAAAGGALVVLGGAWVLAVALAGAGSRPYIGASTDNTIWDVVWNYNGPGRVFSGTEDDAIKAAPHGFFGAPPGMGRLFAADVAGQLSWLMVIAAVGLVAGLWLTRRAPRTDLARASFALWGGWAVLHFLVLSFAKGSWHAYYTVAMAPGIAALTGAGIVTLARSRERWAGPVLALGLAATVGVDVVFLRRTPHYHAWLVPTLLVVAVLVALAGAATLAVRQGPAGGRLVAGAAALGLLGMLAGPAVYDVTTVRQREPAGLQQAGPYQKSVTPPVVWQAMPQIRKGGQAAFPAQLLAMLKAQRGHARWLLGVTDGPTSGALILATHEPVMDMGGYRGTDPALSAARLRGYVTRGDLRFVLLTPPQAQPPKLVLDRDRWIRGHCASMNGGQPANPRTPVLYDCAPRAPRTRP
ncbi:MAG: ArnT family glycosyltransferase [Mycobacteriales bacterium]